MSTASSILSKKGENYIHYYCCKKCQALFKSIPELLEHGKNCVGTKILDTGGRLYAYQSSFLKGFVECILTCSHTKTCPLLFRNEITPEGGPATVTNVVSREGLVIVTTEGEASPKDAAHIEKFAGANQAAGKDLEFDDNGGADSDEYDPLGDDDYSDDSMPGKVVQGAPVTRSRFKTTKDCGNAKVSTTQKGPPTRSKNKEKKDKEPVTTKRGTPTRTPATRSKGVKSALEGQVGDTCTPTVPALSTSTTKSKKKANSVEETLIVTRSKTTPIKGNTVQKSPATRSKAKAADGHETRSADKPLTQSVQTAQTPTTTSSKVSKNQKNVTTLPASATVHTSSVPIPTTTTPMQQTSPTCSNIRVKVVRRQGNKEVVTDAILRKTTPGKMPVNNPKPIEEPENEAIKAIIAKKYRPIRPRPLATAESQAAVPQNTVLRLAVVPQPQENVTPNPNVVNTGPLGPGSCALQESSDLSNEVGLQQDNAKPSMNANAKTETEVPQPTAEQHGGDLESEGSAVEESPVLNLKVTDVRGNVTADPTNQSISDKLQSIISSATKFPKTCDDKKSPKTKAGKKLKSQSCSDKAGASLAKKHVCQLCDHKSDSPTGLEHHMKVHLRRKLWQCIVCGHEDVTERKMSAHIEQKHAGSRFQDVAIRIGLQEIEVSGNEEHAEPLQGASSVDIKPMSIDFSETSNQAEADKADHSVSDSVPVYDDIELDYNNTDHSMTEPCAAVLVEHGDPNRGDHCYGLMPMVNEEPVDGTTQSDTTIKYQVRKARPPHKCKHCFYRTWNKARFLKHVHGHSIVEKQPSVLPKRALKASNLKDRWFGCPRCQFETGHGGVFRKHMMVHLGIQPWECAICGKRGITQQQIQLHIKWKHKDRSIEYLKDAAVKHDIEIDLNLYDYRIPNVGRHSAGKTKSLKGKIKRGHTVKSPFASYRVGANIAKEYACQWCDVKCDSPIGLEHHMMSHVRSNLWQCVVCGHEDATEIKMSAHLEEKHFGCKFEDSAIRLGLQEQVPVPRRDEQLSSFEQADLGMLGDSVYNLGTVDSHVQDNRTVDTNNLQTPENMHILMEVGSEETATYVPITDPGINLAIAGHTQGTLVPMTNTGPSFAVAGPSHTPLPEADWQFNMTPSKGTEYFTIELFGCDMCDFKIGNATRFKQHMLSHQGIKPWQCSICYAGDANKHNIAVHVKSFHRDVIGGRTMKFITDMSKSVDIDLERYKIVCKRRRTKKKQK